MDFIVLRQFICSAESILNEFLKSLVDGGSQLVSHGQGGTIGTGSRSAFLNAGVPLDDAIEVGPVVANRLAFDLYGIIILL